jgi:hypothetical protein
MEKKYKVRVSTPGHKIVFKEKILRTPVVFNNVIKSDLDLIKLQCQRLMLKYTIDVEGEKPMKPVSPMEVIDLTEEKEIKVEELETKEPTTILEKLLQDDK